MPDFDFRVESAAPIPFAASPMLGFRVAVHNATAEPVHSVALHAQIQLEVTRRRYSKSEQENLIDLYGEPGRWGQTLRAMLWTNVDTTVPAFTGDTSFEIQVPCTFDFNIAATKYFHGLEGGQIPLCFLFSGMAFYDSGSGPRISPIPWSKESRFPLPVATWRDMMELYYPGSVWLRLRSDLFDRLYQFKVRHGIPTWEAALERILAASEEALTQ